MSLPLRSLVIFLLFLAITGITATTLIFPLTNSQTIYAQSTPITAEIQPGYDWWLPDYVEVSPNVGRMWVANIDQSNGIPKFLAQGGIWNDIGYATKLELNWKELNPSPGVYNWEKLDAALNTATAFSETNVTRAHIGIWLRFNRAEFLPDWVKEQYTIVYNTREYQGHYGVDAGHPDSEFQVPFKTFTKALGDHIKANPAFLYVTLDKPMDPRFGEWGAEEARDFPDQAHVDAYRDWVKQYFDDWADALSGYSYKGVNMINRENDAASPDLIEYAYSLGFGKRLGGPSSNDATKTALLGYDVKKSTTNTTSTINRFEYTVNDQLPPQNNRNTINTSETTEFDTLSDDFGPAELTEFRFITANLFNIAHSMNWFAFNRENVVKAFPEVVNWTLKVANKSIEDGPEVWSALVAGETDYNTKPTPSAQITQHAHFLERGLYHRQTAPDGISQFSDPQPKLRYRAWDQDYGASRTDLAQGSPHLYFTIHDGFLKQDSTYPVMLKVTYLDNGGGTWWLEYATAQGAVKTSSITNTNTGTLKTASFSIPNFQANKSFTAGNDFRITADTEDVSVRLVRLIKLSKESPVSCPSDINSDGITDITDYSILVTNFLRPVLIHPRADIDQDGIVDITDYSLLVANFLKTCR